MCTFKCSFEKIKVLWFNILFVQQRKEDCICQELHCEASTSYFLLRFFNRLLKQMLSWKLIQEIKKAKGKNNNNGQLYLIVSMVQASSWVTDNSSSVSFHCLEIILSIVISKPLQSEGFSNRKPYVMWSGPACDGDIWVNDDWCHITFHKVHTS